MNGRVLRVLQRRGTGRTSGPRAPRPLRPGGRADGRRARPRPRRRRFRTLGPLGVIVASAVAFTGRRSADPLIGAGVGSSIAPRIRSLLREAVHTLMEDTPARVDPALLERELLGIPGVRAAHDAHVWTVTSGLNAINGRLVAAAPPRTGRVCCGRHRPCSRSASASSNTTIPVEDAVPRAAEPDSRVRKPGG